MSKAKGKSATKSLKAPYKFKSFEKADHDKKKLVYYGVQFCQFLKPGQPDIFATVGGNKVSIYKCLENGGMEMIHSYADPHVDKDNEEFYTCCWSIDIESNKPILAVGGSRGVIWILNVTSEIHHKHYLGHGDAINWLTFHPNKPEMLLSASSDHSMRLWNTKTDVCVAIFGGPLGHLDHIESADFHLSGEFIVSSGKDEKIKVWRTDLISVAMEKSVKFDASYCCDGPFETVNVYSPETTSDIYNNHNVDKNFIVDCVKWFGDLIFSRANYSDSIVCSESGLEDNSHPDTEVCRFKYANKPKKLSESWFIRFALDANNKYMALGHDNGTISIWDLDQPHAEEMMSAELTHPECRQIIRQTTFSRDGKILISIGDHTIWRWDRVDF